MRDAGVTVFGLLVARLAVSPARMAPAFRKFRASLAALYARRRAKARASLHRRMVRGLLPEVRAWQRLRFVSEDDRRALRRRFLDRQATSVIIEAIITVIQLVLIVGFELGAIVLWISTYDVIHFHGIDFSNYSGTWVGGPMILLGIELFLLIGAINFFDRRYIGNVILWGGVWFPVLLALAALGFSGYRLSVHGEPEPYCAVFGVSVMSIYILVCSITLFLSFVFNIIRAALEARYAEAIIVHRVFSVVRTLGQGDEGWLGTGARSSAIAEIDRAAALIRLRLFRALHSEDQGTKLWRDERALRVSHALREKEQWLITPKPDTREHLAEALSGFVVSLLAGAWDSLEASEGDLALSQRPVRIALRVIRTVLIGFLPAAIFATGHYMGWFSLGSPIDSYVLGGLTLWGLVTVVSVFDPLLKEKISTVKDIVGVFRGGKKD